MIVLSLQPCRFQCNFNVSKDCTSQCFNDNEADERVLIDPFEG